MRGLTSQAPLTDAHTHPWERQISVLEVTSNIYLSVAPHPQQSRCGGPRVDGGGGGETSSKSWKGVVARPMCWVPRARGVSLPSHPHADGDGDGWGALRRRGAKMGLAAPPRPTPPRPAPPRRRCRSRCLRLEDDSDDESPVRRRRCLPLQQLFLCIVDGGTCRTDDCSTFLSTRGFEK